MPKPQVPPKLKNMKQIGGEEAKTDDFKFYLQEGVEEESKTTGGDRFDSLYTGTDSDTN
jgi:hypothetical protein